MERYKIIGLIGFIMALVSLVLPWAEISSILGHITIYGFSTDGVISFIVLLICLGLLLSKFKPWKRYLSALLTFISLAIVVAAMVHASEAMRELGGGVFVSFGPGGPLMIIASLTFFIAIILWKQAPPS
ncbi:MAG: hypothetical protein QXG35_10300 [Nitrososphaerota archaeon]